MEYLIASEGNQASKRTSTKQRIGRGPAATPGPPFHAYLDGGYETLCGLDLDDLRRWPDPFPDDHFCCETCAAAATG
jgi:hypothetical protein